MKSVIKTDIKYEFAVISNYLITRFSIIIAIIHLHEKCKLHLALGRKLFEKYYI